MSNEMTDSDVPRNISLHSYGADFVHSKNGLVMKRQVDDRYS